MCRLLTFRRCFSYSFCHYIEVVVASDVTRKLFQITWRWLPAAAAAAADIPSRLRCLVVPASLPRGCLASWTSSSACSGLWLRAQLQTKTPAQHQTSVCLSAGGCPAEIDNQTSSGRGSIAAAPAADYDVTWRHYVSQWCVKLLHTAASVYVESKLLSKPSSFTSFISQPSRETHNMIGDAVNTWHKKNAQTNFYAYRSLPAVLSKLIRQPSTMHIGTI